MRLISQQVKAFSAEYASSSNWECASALTDISTIFGSKELNNPMNDIEWVTVCGQSDVAPGAMLAIDHADLPPIAIFNVDGALHATGNVCTHNVAILTDGAFSGRIVECPLHGGAFDVTSGEAVAYPCETGLKTFPIAVVNGDVRVGKQARCDGVGTTAAFADTIAPQQAVPNPEISVSSSGSKQVRIAESTDVFTVGLGDTLLQGALRAGIGFPYECNSGGCGSCIFELVEGQVQDQWPEAPALSSKARASGRLLACQSVPSEDCVVRVRTNTRYVTPVQPIRRTVQFESITMLTPDMALLRFMGEGAAAFLPGQYALLRLDSGEQVRAYSMSNLPNEKGLWEFIIKRVHTGHLTPQLHALTVGNVAATLDGPYGIAFLQTDSERDVLCIAGGAGLSPMMSILRGAAADRRFDERRLHLFYGGRSAPDMCDARLLADDPTLAERVNYTSAISTVDENWPGEKGFIHDVVARKLGSQLRDFEIYLSGPPVMVDVLQKMLLIDYRVPSAQIHFDRFC